MTAAGIDALSDGRFHLGLGASGPQVIEGFHGVPYTNPLGRTREIIEICRDVWRREAPLVHHGQNFTLPLPARPGHRARQAAQDHRPPGAQRDPDLDRLAGREERRDDRRDRRRLDPDPLHPRARAARSGAAPWPRARAKRDPALGELMITAGGLLAIGEGEEVVAPARARSVRWSRSTSGAWARRARTSTTSSPCATASSGRPRSSRTSTSRGKKKEAEAAVPAEFLELTTLCGPAGLRRRARRGLRRGRRHPPPGPPDPARAARPAASLIETVQGVV